MSLISSVVNLPKQQSLDGVENDVFQMPINETTTTHPQMVGLWCPGIPSYYFEILLSNMHKKTLSNIGKNFNGIPCIHKPTIPRYNLHLNLLSQQVTIQINNKLINHPINNKSK